MAGNVRKTAEEIALPIAEGMGYFYVDTEYAKQGRDYVLTIFIDQPGGVTLEDCEKVSRAVEQAIDEKDFIADKYCLCVSSPGLDRPLKTARDFERCLTQVVDVKIYKPFEGKKEFVGVLVEYDENSIMIRTEENEIRFELSEIAKVSLHLDI